jgi:hypothetical protein
MALFLFTSLLSTSCLSRRISCPPAAITDGKLFELKIYSDKQEYKTTEKINIWSTLEYTGKEDQIKIWHGEPYIIYSITDGKDFKLDGVVLDILKSTVLEKEKIYRFDYIKTGGYSEDDPKANFWKEFFSEKDLYLPVGEYTIKAAADFSLGDDVVNSRYEQTAELKIKIVK